MRARYARNFRASYSCDIQHNTTLTFQAHLDTFSIPTSTRLSHPFSLSHLQEGVISFHEPETRVSKHYILWTAQSIRHLIVYGRTPSVSLRSSLRLEQSNEHLPLILNIECGHDSEPVGSAMPNEWQKIVTGDRGMSDRNMEIMHSMPAGTRPRLEMLMNLSPAVLRVIWLQSVCQSVMGTL